MDDTGKENRAAGKAPSRGRKSRSRLNAVKHGLTASTVLPQILAKDLVNEYFQNLSQEWQPATSTERFCVREMARHQASLERVEQIEEAVLRRGARGAYILPSETDLVDERLDAALAAAGTSEAAERITRYRRAHERGFLQNLAVLQDLRARNSDQKTPLPAPNPPARTGTQQSFASEQECEAYLAARGGVDRLACPQCGGREGAWIATRQLWQCATCRHQVSLRAGSVMVGSRLSLLVWFRAIETLLKNPTASTEQLITATGIQRAATIRRMARRIRAAMHSQHRSAALAGLDTVFEFPGSSLELS